MRNEYDDDANNFWIGCRYSQGYRLQQSAVECALFVVATDATWLPHALVEVGFFDSGNQVKKNRPDLRRDLIPGETVTLDWAEIVIQHSREQELEDEYLKLVELQGQLALTSEHPTPALRRVDRQVELALHALNQAMQREGLVSILNQPAGD